MPYWEFPDESSLDHLGSIAFNDWEPEDLENRPKRKKIPFGFRAPEPEKPRKKRASKRVLRK